MVNHCHVIADEHDRAAKVAQVLRASDSGPADDSDGRKDDRIQQRDSQPANWPALLPAAIQEPKPLPKCCVPPTRTVEEQGGAGGGTRTHTAF